jgi:hypothetical protein
MVFSFRSFVASIQDALWYASYYCNGNANKYNTDLHNNFKWFLTAIPNRAKAV